MEEIGYIGSDEAGKGDFFGPLCVAAVYATAAERRALHTLGIKDSKTLSDKKNQLLAQEIRTLCLYDQIVIFPKRYNLLYPKFRNLNYLLAWAHAALIEQLYKNSQAPLAIVDAFTKEPLVENYLKKKQIPLTVSLIEKGESDIVVAAASILARAAFIEGLALLEKEFNVTLPKGSGPPASSQALSLFQGQGRQLFPSIAKLHFKTYKQLG